MFGHLEIMCSFIGVAEHSRVILMQMIRERVENGHENVFGARNSVWHSKWTSEKKLNATEVLNMAHLLDSVFDRRQNCPKLHWLVDSHLLLKLRELLIGCIYLLSPQFSFHLLTSDSPSSRRVNPGRVALLYCMCGSVILLWWILSFLHSQEIH